MIISKGSQLGLRFVDKEVKIQFCESLKLHHEGRITSLSTEIDFIKQHQQKVLDGMPEHEVKAQYDEFRSNFTLEGSLYNIGVAKIVSERTQSATGVTFEFLQSILQENSSSKFFFICDSVYRAAELIKINEGFTARTLKDIALGHYTYLMGRHRMVRFMVAIGAIKGLYYDDEKNIAFEFGLNIDTGEYYATAERKAEFSMIMQVLSFVELGDIEVVELKGGRNNGKAKNEGKITNPNHYTVFVVDSSWNKLIIRTDGFAVRGHFRLQPCGTAMLDRKLVWINAFEKHGYTRRPKAEIVH